MSYIMFLQKEENNYNKNSKYQDDDSSDIVHQSDYELDKVN